MPQRRAFDRLGVYQSSALEFKVWAVFKMQHMTRAVYSMSNEYVFTSDWFSAHKPSWNNLLEQGKPKRYLEIGSYEGRSACHVIEQLGIVGELEIHCVDTWEGSGEHTAIGIEMAAVEKRVDHNVSLAMNAASHQVDVHKHKAPSDHILPLLLASLGAGSFDMIYVDGSHQAPDVLADAVLSFKLLREGGILIFDDYLWREDGAPGNDLTRCPKIAIDAFTNIHSKKLRILNGPLAQIYAIKTAV